MKPMCPKCGKELLYETIVMAYRKKKINEDGSISKLSQIIIEGEYEETPYLHCDDCDFNYNLTNELSDYPKIKKFDDWYKKNKKNEEV